MPPTEMLSERSILELLNYDKKEQIVNGKLFANPKGFGVSLFSSPNTVYPENAGKRSKKNPPSRRPEKVIIKSFIPACSAFVFKRQKS